MTPALPLPRGWPAHARRALLHAIALARVVLSAAATSVRTRRWVSAVQTAAVAQEEARLLRARLEHVPAAHRPHYPATARLAILELRTAMGWTLAETARRFLITPETVSSWMRRLDEEGPRALVRAREPVNRFPHFVRELVRALRSTLPMLGKVRLAQMLARLGLHLTPSTVARMLKESSRPRRPPRATRTQPASTTAIVSRVTARGPHDVWHVDLTALPLVSGWWVPWLPQALSQVWPFCFWLAAVLDHTSRSVMAWSLHRKQPSAAEVCRLLDAARAQAGRPPRYIISDQGTQFEGEFHEWCKANGVRPRFGAVGESGSIAIIERFFRSLKGEMLRRLSVLPLSKVALGKELAAWLDWHHHHRPHQGLGGQTPAEVLRGLAPAKDGARIATRERDGPEQVRELAIRIEFVRGKRHLPIIHLKRAA